MTDPLPPASDDTKASESDAAGPAGADASAPVIAPAPGQGYVQPWPGAPPQLQGGAGVYVPGVAYVPGAPYVPGQPYTPGQLYTPSAPYRPAPDHVPTAQHVPTPHHVPTPQHVPTAQHAPTAYTPVAPYAAPPSTAPGAAGWPPPAVRPQPDGVGYDPRLPPYAQPVATAPGAPVGAAPYGYAPPVGVAPNPARGRMLGVVGLVLAVLGALLVLAPAMRGAANPFLLAGLIIGIIALASRRSTKGPGIAAIAVSVLGGILSAVLTVVSFVGVFDTGPDSAAPPESSFPGTAPSDGLLPEEIVVTELAFGQASFDDSSWWYVAVLDNTDPTRVYDGVDIEASALDADGDVVDTTYAFTWLPDGSTAISGSFYDEQGTGIDSVVLTAPWGATPVSPGGLGGTLAVEDLRSSTAASGVTTVTGMLRSTFAERLEYALVTVVARDQAGAIVGGDITYVDLPANGETAFESAFYDELPMDATFEAYATR